MKLKSIVRRICHLEIQMLLILTFLLSCNGGSSSTETTTDSTSVIAEDSSKMSPDTSAMRLDTSTVSVAMDSLVKQLPPPSDVLPEKGLAMVYCPAKMIRNIPSIVNATISREELSKAMENLNHKVQGQNKDVKKQ